MRKLCLIGTLLYLSTNILSCTPEVLSEDQNIEFQATGGDDGDVISHPDDDDDLLGGN